MSRVYYNKLIRDKIPEKIKGNGKQCSARACADDAEFQQELLKKVAEEASALAVVRSREAYLEELADLLVVLDALNEALAVSTSDIERAKEANLQKKGAFEKRLFLVWSSDTGYKSNESAQGIRE